MKITTLKAVSGFVKHFPKEIRSDKESKLSISLRDLKLKIMWASIAQIN